MRYWIVPRNAEFTGKKWGFRLLLVASYFAVFYFAGGPVHEPVRPDYWPTQMGHEAALPVDWTRWVVFPIVTVFTLLALRLTRCMYQKQHQQYGFFCLMFFVLWCIALSWPAEPAAFKGASFDAIGLLAGVFLLAFLISLIIYTFKEDRLTTSENCPRWKVVTSIKWIATFLLLAQLLLSYLNPICMLNAITIVAVWSSPQKRVARVAATIAQAAVGLFFMFALFYYPGYTDLARWYVWLIFLFVVTVTVVGIVAAWITAGPRTTSG